MLLHNEAELEFIDLMGEFPGFREHLRAEVDKGEFHVNSIRTCFFAQLGKWMAPTAGYSEAKKLLFGSAYARTEIEIALWNQNDVEMDGGISLIRHWLETI